MLENNNQKETIVPDGELKNNYYTTTGKKVGDFFLGFFGILILNFILGIILSPLLSFASLEVISVFISIIIFVSLVVIFFKINRRFIAIGIISMALIPVLIFGSCLLLLGAGGLGM